MSALETWRVWVLVIAAVSGIGAVACDPDDPCDPGYYADYGACVRVVDASGKNSDDDAGFAHDDSDFGRPCEVTEDCGGRAPVCGAPMLPLCTAVNCMQGESQCPADWTCLDITGWERPYPEIESICVKL